MNDIKLGYNSLQGKKCYCLGNGPSINDFDFCQIDREQDIIIGANRIFLKFIPDILVWIDDSLYIDHKEQIDKLECIKMCAKRGIKNRKTIYQEDIIKLDLHKCRIRCREEKFGIHGAPQNSGFLCCQLADYLGCSEINIVGFDGCINGQEVTHFYGKNKRMTKNSRRNYSSGLIMIKNYIVPHHKVISYSSNSFFPRVASQV